MYRLTKSWPDAHMQKLASWTLMMMNSVGTTAKAFGVSREAVIAQAALESAWGAAAIGNNLFGIKANAGWAGLTRQATTQEWVNGQFVTITDTFRDYATVADSVADHFQFLVFNGRYANIIAEGATGKMTDQRYFTLLQADGYATDPQYANKLMAMLGSVKIFTSCMVDDTKPMIAADAPPPGYVTTETGNVIREDIHQSSIVQNADMVTKVTTGAAAASAVGGAAASFGGMDFKVILALAVLMLAGAGVFALYKVLQMKQARLDMHAQGVA